MQSTHVSSTASFLSAKTMVSLHTDLVAGYQRLMIRETQALLIHPGRCMHLLICEMWNLCCIELGSTNLVNEDPIEEPDLYAIVESSGWMPSLTETIDKMRANTIGIFAWTETGLSQVPILYLVSNILAVFGMCCNIKANYPTAGLSITVAKHRNGKRLTGLSSTTGFRPYSTLFL
jgi:hypothetical protein